MIYQFPQKFGFMAVVLLVRRREWWQLPSKMWHHGPCVAVRHGGVRNGGASQPSLTCTNSNQQSASLTDRSPPRQQQTEYIAPLRVDW